MITYFEVKGYKHIHKLAGIKRLVLTPESMYQFIIGTNGSGKSSIINELSPLPAVPAHYEKNGYKIFEATYRGHRYRLVSEFKSENKHQFLRDEVELNDGGTGAAQKELVERYFGLTADIHNLLTGRTLFTQMGPAKRREWITKLCEVDFTYSLGLHQKLKSATRDRQGALKHVQQRVTQETQSLAQLEEAEAQLDAEYDHLHQELELLAEEKDNSAEQTSAVDQHIEEILESIGKYTTQLVQYKPDMPAGYRFDSLESIDETLQQLKVDHEVQRNRRQQIGEDYESLEQLINNFEAHDVKDQHSIDAQRQKLSEAIAYHDERAPRFRENMTSDPAKAYDDIIEIRDRLHYALDQLPANPYRRFTNDNLRSAYNDAQNAEQSLHQHNRKLARLEADYEHLLGLKEQQCPVCGHSWVPGKSEHSKEVLESNIETVKGDCERCQKSLDNANEEIEKIEEYRQAMYRYRQLSQAFPSLNDLWEYLSLGDKLYERPQELKDDVATYVNEVYHLKEKQAAERRYKSLGELIVSGDQTTQLDELKRRLSALDTQINTVTTQATQLSAELQSLQRYRQRMARYIQGADKLNTLLEELEERTNAWIRANRAQHINAVIRKNRDRLGYVQTKHNEKRSLKDRLDQLQQDEQQLTHEHQVLAQLTKELSPAEGLIADQLGGFINMLVRQMNSIIGQVWTYEMKVLPCGLDDKDLDYKFPIDTSFETNDKPIPDVSLGSKSQTEIVNIAFRLVVMHCLDLADHPIFLDEVGPSFDEQHRVNVLEFIKQLVDNGDYPQLFIVSHYIDAFNIYYNANIMVLDDRNIILPESYNSHAQLET